MCVKMAVLVTNIAADSSFQDGRCSDVDDDDNHRMLFCCGPSVPMTRSQ